MRTNSPDQVLGCSLCSKFFEKSNELFIESSDPIFASYSRALSTNELLGHFFGGNFAQFCFLENGDRQLRSDFCNVIYIKNVGWKIHEFGLR